MILTLPLIGCEHNPKVVVTTPDYCPSVVRLHQDTTSWIRRAKKRTKPPITLKQDLDKLNTQRCPIVFNCYPDKMEFFGCNWVWI